MFKNRINFNNRIIKQLSIILGFIVFSSIIFLFLIVKPASIGISYDWETPLSLNYFIKTPLNSVWVNNGQIIPGNTYYFQIFYWLLMSCHLDNVLITVLFLVFIFSFSAYFIYLLLKKISSPSWIAILSGLLYITSSQLLLITHHGYTNYLISFCFTPLLIYFYLSYLEKPKFVVALTGAVVFNLAASQINFYVINSFILLIFSCFYFKQWRLIIKLILIYLVVNVLLSASWFLVYLNDLRSLKNLNTSALNVAYAGFQRNSLMDLFYLPWVFWSIKDYLTTLHLKWFYYIWTFGQILIFSLPFVVYGFYRKKINAVLSKLFMAGFILLAFGFLLTKGGAQPFSWTGDWFYKLPFSGLFRDLNYFYYLVTFSIIWLFALAVYILSANIKKDKYYQRLFFSLLALFVLINAFPYILNVYQSRLHRYELKLGAYDSLIEKYNNDLSDFRLLWLPGGFYVQYNDGQLYYAGRNPLINLVTKEDLPDLGPETSQPSLLTKVLEFGYCSRIKNCTERLLGLFNVRDIINLKKDFSSTASLTADRNLMRNEKYWTASYYDTWSKNLNDAAKALTNDFFDVYQLSDKQYLPHLYVPKELTWIEGDSKNILDGIIMTKENQTGYIINDTFRSNVNKVIIPLEFSEDSGLKFYHNDYQIVTSFNVPEDGTYQLIYYQKHRETTSPGVIFKVMGLDLDHRIITLEKVDNSESRLDQQNPLVSGNLFLRKGGYQVALSNTINDLNLVVDSSFEIGGWSEPTYDCTSVESDYQVNKTEDREHYLQFHNKQKQVCQTRVVGGLQPHQKYLFAYDVQHVSGEKPVVCLKLDEQDYCHGINMMAENNYWQHFEFIFEEGDSNRALIYFAVPGSANKSINNFDNFELRQVGLPETMSLVKDKPAAGYQVSYIEYRKISNTKYRVILKSASGNIPLVFTENYNLHWMAYVKSENSSQPADIKENKTGGTIQNNSLPTGGLWETQNLPVIKDHQKINGYSNVWYYPVENGPKDVEIIIEYKPQKLFVIGQYLAIITFSLIILFFVIKDFLKISFINKTKN